MHQHFHIIHLSNDMFILQLLVLYNIFIMSILNLDMTYLLLHLHLIFNIMLNPYPKNILMHYFNNLMDFYYFHKLQYLHLQYIQFHYVHMDQLNNNNIYLVIFTHLNVKYILIFDHHNQYINDLYHPTHMQLIYNVNMYIMMLYYYIHKIQYQMVIFHILHYQSIYNLIKYIYILINQ